MDAKGNTQISWFLTIPETVNAVQYKVVAKAGAFSDGEQNAMPVLSPLQTYAFLKREGITGLEVINFYSIILQLAKKPSNSYNFSKL